MSTHYFRFALRGGPDRHASPLLERLLARADGFTTVGDWRAEAFRVVAPHQAHMPGLGACALYAECGAVQGGSVLFATPVHYVAEMSNVRLPADGIVTLQGPEAETLCADFNRVWSDAGIRLMTGRHAGLFCVLERPLSVVTEDPENVLDQHLAGHLPTGADAAHLRRLMSEIEMWLFEHAVNRRRAARAESTLSSLWLWGQGPPLAALPPVEGWAAGDDPFFRAFAAPPDPTGAAAPAGGASAREMPGVVAVGAQPGSDAWRKLQSGWLEGSLAALRAGRIDEIRLSAGSRCFNVGRRSRWRWWRRPRAWREYFA